MNIDGDVKVVNFLKAKKIEHDKLIAAIAQQEVRLKTDTDALRNLEEKVASGIPLEKAMATEMTNASAAEEIALENKEKQLSTLKQNQENNRSVQMDKTDNNEKSHTSPTHTREQVAKMSGVGAGTVARYDLRLPPSFGLVENKKVSNKLVLT